MTLLERVKRLTAVSIAVLIVGASAGCGSMLSGSALAASSVAVSTTGVTARISAYASSVPTAPARSSVVRTTSTWLPSSSALQSTPGAARTGWSAVIETGPGIGIPSPIGDLAAQFVSDQVCFVPASGDRRCAPLAGGATPTFAVFSADGSELLLVVGPATAAGVYIFDTADGTARVLGPSGAQDFSVGGTHPQWDLSSAVWGADGAVLLVPRTEAATGPVLQFDLFSGAVSELLRMDATLANSSPSIWTTQAGLAVVANSGDERNAVWWLDFATGSADRIAVLPESGGTIALSSADPLGRFVLICPRRADGALGAITAVAVDHSENVRLLSDSLSCAGSVSSSDGSYLAMTAEVDGSYRLIVVEVASSSPVLTVPLLVSTPSAPPYLTWNGNVIVAADVTGEWPVPSVVARLQR